MTELPDRLVRGALRRTASTTPSEMCVDAEALAAWADGTMPAAARAAFEAHAAGCARCQALIAAMVRIEPPRIQPVWWRRQPFAWLVPLATAAVALVIVDLTVTDRRSSPPSSSLARTEPAPVDRGAPSTAAAAPPAAAAPAAAPRREDRAAIDEAKPQASAATRAKSRVATTSAAPSSPAAPKTELASRDAAPPSSAPAASQPPPAPVAAPSSPVVPDAASASALRDAVARSESTRDRVMAPRAMKTASFPILIASPDRNSQWRIVDGKVEHTADGGQTWQARPLDVTTPVRAGAAPAARVCWLAGARGLVLLTTDGDSWLRVAFPESVDLVAIQATDASHATVTSATGRSFSTSDGGKTWTGR